MTLQTWLIAITSIGLSAGAQLLMKSGMTMVRAAGSSDGLGQLLAAATNLLVVAGLATYGLSAVLWLLVLARVELSVAYPIVSLGFILVAVLSWLVLGETLSAMRLGGVALIVAGVVLIGRSSV